MSPGGEYQYQRYEYEFISEPSLVLFGEKLNRFATEGWRLVATATEQLGGIEVVHNNFIGIVERKVQ